MFRRFLICLIGAVLALATVPTWADAATSPLKNVAKGMPVAVTANGGFFVESPYASGSLRVDFGTVTDGVYFPPGTRFDQGPVWWNERGGRPDSEVMILLDDTYEVTEIRLQVDSNEDYQVCWIDIRSGNECIVVRTPGSLLGVPTTFEIDAFTSAFSIQPTRINDDGLYAISEFEAFAAESTENQEREVAIDFKTNDGRNVFNPRSMGRVWVAILSDSDFDAQQVDPGTVALGRGGATPDRYVVGDRNRDRVLDLVLRFRTPEIGLQCSDAEVTLTGETYTGENISGTDSISTVGCK